MPQQRIQAIEQFEPCHFPGCKRSANTKLSIDGSPITFCLCQRHSTRYAKQAYRTIKDGIGHLSELES